MIPQGALDLSSALNRLSGREVAADRSEGEKAWRFLCALILERRVVTPYCLTESGETVELARDQFAGLAEKWIFVATEPLQYCTRTECQVGRFYGPARSKWRDTHGRLVYGPIIFFEGELAKVLTVNTQKRIAVNEAIERLGREHLSQLLQKEREKEVLNEVRRTHNLKVTDRHVRNIWNGR